MKYINILGLLVVVIATGCGQSTKQVASESWRTLTIWPDQSIKITVNNDSDTATVNVFHRGSFFSPRPKNTKVNVDTIQTLFTRAEKDTLFLLAKDLILNPAKIPGKCSEYVGHLELDIDYGQFRQYGEYTSVCNWNSLSNNTKHLHAILRRKIKNVYLGEQN